MARPKGSKNKNVKKTEEIKPILGTEEPVAIIEKKRMVTPVFKPGESKAQEMPPKVIEKLEPLGEGQQYFEAPDGTILIGEKTATRMWYRAGSMWINPKREPSIQR